MWQGKIRQNQQTLHRVYVYILFESVARFLWQPNVCMCAQKKIALPISVSHQMYVCGGCDKVHARNCVSVCGEVEEAFINVWVWVRVITCLHLCVCERHCVCQREKKNTALWLSSDILKASKPRTEKVLWKQTKCPTGMTDRETARERVTGRWRRKYWKSESEREKTQQEGKVFRGRARTVFIEPGGEEGPVQFHWFEAVGGDRTGTEGRQGDRVATVRKWLYNTVKKLHRRQSDRKGGKRGKHGRHSVEETG